MTDAGQMLQTFTSTEKELRSVGLEKSLDADVHLRPQGIFSET